VIVLNRKIIIVAGLIGLIILIITYGGGEELIEKNIEVVEIKRETFIYDYKTFGIVDSKSHHFFFNGYIKNIHKKAGEEVKKKEKILSYIDEHGNSKDLLSEIDGFVYQIENNCLILKDLDFFVVVELAYEKYSLLKENDICFIGINDNYYEAEVIEKVKFANQDNKYRVIIKTDYLELIFSQHVNVTFHLEKKDGLTVDKRALNYDEKGYYLIDEDFKEELNNLEKYRLPVEVIMCNDDLALISAIGLEDKKVCILSNHLKEFLSDQVR
jgi:hypothetical protein